jgi:hypothetical protein
MKRSLSSNWASAAFAAIAALAATVFPGASVAHASGEPAPALGVPTHIARAVLDLEAVTNQWAAGVGTEFGPITSSVHRVDFPGVGSASVTLRHVFSVAGAPFVELVQADPPIGPWVADPVQSSG